MLVPLLRQISGDIITEEEVMAITVEEVTGIMVEEVVVFTDPCNISLFETLTRGMSS